MGMRDEDESPEEGKEDMESLHFDPNREETIIITFREPMSRRKTEMKVMMPSKMSLAFHWWMVTKGILEV